MANIGKGRRQLSQSVIRQALRSGEPIPEGLLPKKTNLRPGLELYLLAYLSLQGERRSDTSRLPYSAVAFYAADNLFSEFQTEALFYLVDELDTEHIKRQQAAMKREEQRINEFARNGRKTR